MSAPGPAASGAGPGSGFRTIEWTGDAVRVLDQTALPGELCYLELHDVEALVGAIRRLAVRGAPALGAAGALGVLLALRQSRRAGWSRPQLEQAIEQLREARPTAANLAWGVERVRPLLDHGEAAVLAAALELAAQDERANRAIGRSGADWVLAHVAHRPVRVLTHCNAGALATTAWGTALGLVRELEARGLLGTVYVDETRPLLQGARLTAFELAGEGIEHVVLVDGAAAGTLASGAVDVAVIGADRIAANGDTANKVGSLGVALACAHAGVPFVVCAPEATIDPSLESGEGIPIELRPEEEVLSFAGVRVTPATSRAHNPAFDVTPGSLVSALVTERRVLAVSAGELPGAGSLPPPQRPDRAAPGPLGPRRAGHAAALPR